MRYFDEDGTWIPGLDNDGNVTYTAEKGDNYNSFVRQFACNGKGKEIFKNSGYGLEDGSVKEGQIIKGETVKKITGNEVLKGNWDNMSKTQKAAQIMFALRHGESISSEIGDAYAIDLNDYIIDFSTLPDGLRLYQVKVPETNSELTTVNMVIAPMTTIEDAKHRFPVCYRGIAAGENSNTIHYYCGKNIKAKCKPSAVTITPLQK